MLADIIVEIAAEHILTDVPGGYLGKKTTPSSARGQKSFSYGQKRNSSLD
jgi:hypothetical protein